MKKIDSVLSDFLGELPPPLKVVSVENFLKMPLPKREDILSPILQTQSLSMLYAKRGVGKTHFALGIAYAISSGGTFLKWSAPRPRPVLYLDGEMSAQVMQERLAAISQRNEKQPPEGCFNLMAADLNPDIGMPDISTIQGQEKISPYTDAADVIIIDNISTLVRTGKENEAEGWLPLQQWALQMRRTGKSVIFIHHAGKNGEQRGTSRREDVLDLVMRLQNPKDYKSSQGARVEVHFEKARNLNGADSDPFEAHLTDNGWIYNSIENADLMRVLQLKAEGMTYDEIHAETGISRSRAQRLVAGHVGE